MNQPKKVVIGVVEKEGEFLIIERAKPEGDLLWAFPGGKLEHFDKTEEDCVKREVIQETSVECLPIKRLGERLVANNTILISYRLCTYLSGEPRITRHDEVKQVRWATSSKIHELFTTDIYPAVEEYISQTV